MSQLYVAHYGDPDGKPLVLIHGWGMHSSVWNPLVERLAHYAVTLIDLPGLGRSADLIPDPYSLDAVVELLADVAPEKATWLGWSLGGIAAMAFAEQYPERVSKLVTLATSPCFVQRDDWSAGMAPQVFAEFEASLKDNPVKTLQRFNMLQVQGSASARSDLKQLKLLLAETSQPSATGLSYSLALLRDDYRYLFSGIKLPVLHILCQLDSLAPAEIASGLVELCPTAKVEVLSEQSHVPLVSAPEKVVALLESWL